MCYNLIAPFFAHDSIHLRTLQEFNLYLSTRPPLQDMLDLIRFISNSGHSLINLRLELQPNHRYNTTRALLELMAEFVRRYQQLSELYLHVTSTVNKVGIKKLFRSIQTHRNLSVFEMSELQINSTTWNALLSVFDDTNNNSKCNTNLTSFKIHFKYEPWHKIISNQKLGMTNNEPLKIIKALYENQQYLYHQIKAFETSAMQYFNVSKDVILIINAFAFNQTILTLKISGLAHNEVKKKQIECFRWFHELMFNHAVIDYKKHDMMNGSQSVTQQQLLYQLDWNILRSHVVKRQLSFR